jgi:hypothetical protein
MRVVPLGSRGSEVRFHYTPPGLHVGIAATCAALLVMLFAMGSYIGSRVRRPKVEVSM